MYTQVTLTKSIITTWIIIALCGFSIASESSGSFCASSDSFSTRIERKQALLTNMAQDIVALTSLCKKIANKDNVDKTDIRQTLADEKYTKRLQGKLGTLVNETLQKTEYGIPQTSMPLAGTSMVQPESQFKPINLEETLKKRNINQ